MNEKLTQSTDSFYDDDDDNNNNTISPPSLISNIHIVTSKPPIYRQQTQNSNSSNISDHDITDVSSINEQQQQHPFHLESMKNVLFGLSTPTTGLPSPVYSDQQRSIKKDMQILNNNYYQKPYIHNYTKDHRFRLTSSAINRQQQQQRIERENLKILERLQNIRPTRSLKRDELLSNYDRLMSLNIYPIESHFRLPKRPSSTTNLSSTFSISERSHRSQSRPSSATNSLNNNNNNNSIRSRPISASHRSSSVQRRIWNDRWQQQE
ncbi:unnamed protein product [Rotaria sordida]|uniref:Uncharacterized protein n=1 Tax=Rotaria sordida TaxID=392033 RepID=A0A818XVX0_9BILA|nr:unnamed protein product [Rotaria sordida]